MKRRTFISTVTALAGLALAKIKAPAAPKACTEELAAFSRAMTANLTGDTLYTTDNGIYLNGYRLTYHRASDGLYRWLPASCPKDFGSDKPCGTEPMDGYDLLCVHGDDCPMMRKSGIAIPE